MDFCLQGSGNLHNYAAAKLTGFYCFLDDLSMCNYQAFGVNLGLTDVVFVVGGACTSRY